MKRRFTFVLVTFTLLCALALLASFAPVGAENNIPARPAPKRTATDKVKPNDVNKTIVAQQQDQEKASSSEEEESPDIPPFARSIINGEEYHRKRDAHIAMLRGSNDPRAARLRPLAIKEMERQEAQARTDARNRPNTPAIGSWISIGPAPLPNGQTEGVSTAVSGRVSAIAVHPTDENIAYVGAAQGGVYRTLDGGTTWTAIFDTAQSLAIGTIAIAPSQPTTVYVGTGEPNGSCDSFFGVGVYRITNAETTATLAGPFNLDGGANDVFTGRAVGRIVVHPTDPDTIFAGTTSGIGGLNCEAFGGGTVPPLPGRGLYRSTNATTSCTFTKLTTATATNILVGNFPHVDLAMDPLNANRVLVTVNAPINPAGGGTGGGVYLSTDALAANPTFTRTLSLESVRIELGLHSAAGTVNSYAASGESNGRLRRSTDGGSTWSATLGSANGFCGGQCFYDIAIAVSPSDPLIVIIGGNVTGASTKLVARSTDGGATFLNVATGVHADNHAVTFAPDNFNIAYMGTDGGIYKSTNNGQVWSSMNNTGFNATQFQSIAMHPTDAFFTIGGTQDNGTECLGPCGTNPGNTWVRADFGDGGHSVIDQNAVNTTTVTMYHTYFNQSNAKAYARVLTSANAVDNGWTLHGCGFAGSIANGFVCSGPTLFYAPMTRGPGTPNTLYFGADRLYRSVDSGTNMGTVSQLFPVAISAIGVAPSLDNARAVGLSTNGQVWATTTGANPLTNVTNAGFPLRGVGRIAIVENTPPGTFTAYATFTGFGVPAGQHIWKTTNLAGGAATWVASGTGIPDVPVNAIVIDPANASHVYAGTDIGVYLSQDAGATWAPFGTGLPRVAVFDMALQNANRILRVATHGRGIWEITPLGPTAAPATISGRVITTSGEPLAGVTMNLSGGRTARAITDSSGNYRFSNVDTDNFYTVTPSLVNYQFGPTERSFSLVGNKTDAMFTATRNAVITGNAIDTPGFFVRQHYLDFLGREPDESGFNFWSDQIVSCGADAGCMERRTINVSAAYFLSIEFQQTGGLVAGLYRASYDRRPFFAEFMPDVAIVARDVIVGRSGWPQHLEANKQAFVNAWVQRPDFVSRYGSLTNEGYIDTLLSHTGVSFSQAERAALVNGLNTGASTRADVLRQIAENERFVNAKRNETFVMMEYFGYLRRDPDASGFQFWLNKLNQFEGNFEQAEMVKAFINSGEYRARFSR